MHAHPMITPLLPLQVPEEVAEKYDGDTAKAYSLIWDNTLAHLKNPLRAQETTRRYVTGEVVLVARFLQPDGNVSPSLLPELDELRTPSLSLPLSGEDPNSNESLQIRSIQPEYVQQKNRETDTGAILSWLDRLRIVSPGRLGSILGEMEEFGWVRLENGRCQLTELGQEELAVLRSLGNRLQDCTAIARWRFAIDAYVHGDSCLNDLLADSNEVFDMAITLPTKELEEMITGTHSAEEAYVLRAKSSMKTRSCAYFPAGMNPETLIAKDDPLRKRRETLEEALSVGRCHEWLCLPESEKIATRLGAEIARCPSALERQDFLDSVKFDVRSRWLIGLGAESPPPSPEAATRAYRGWIARVPEKHLESPRNPETPLGPNLKR